MKTKNRILTATNYTYLEPKNFQRAKAKGAIWGSASNYLNFLIAQDHKDKASMKASKDLQKEHFTPVLAREPKDRKAEYKRTAKKKKAAKKKSRSKTGGKLLRAAKKKAASRASTSGKKRSAPKAARSKAAPKKTAAQTTSSAVV